MLKCRIRNVLLRVAVPGALGLWGLCRCPAGHAQQPPLAQPRVQSVVRLDDLTEGQTDWTTWQVGNCQPQVTVTKDDPVAGASSLKFAANITGAGDYCALAKDLKELDLADITAFHLRVKSNNVTSIGTQLIDGTGQTHQTKGVPIVADGQWHDLLIEPVQTNGGEHWAGANDGIWHGQPGGINITLSYASAADHKPVLQVADVRADAVQAAVAQAASFKSDFEGGTQLAPGWVAAGEATIDTQTAFQGTHALLLSRAIGGANNERPIVVTGPAFKVTPGQWQFSAATKSQRRSPDDSYNATVVVELLDGAGKVVQRVTVADVFGPHPWQATNKTAEVSPGVPAARFVVQMNKPNGQFWVDDLAASFLAPVPRKDKRVARLLFKTQVLGNLWYPNDPRPVEVAVESTKPLLDEQRIVACEVRDYWGAELTRPMPVTVERKGKNGDRFVYTGSLDLSKVPLETGRYYELHGAVPRPNDEPFRNYTSFAILPAPVTKNYKPEDVPFTSRDWDGRLGDYIRLTDRIGIRIVGLWGGWSAKPPYTPELPGQDIVAKAGQGWISGVPSATIEGGKTDYDEAALRGGVHTFIEQFGKVRPFYISLGNEPHGTGAQVLKNVAAYKAIYEEVKRIDPTITVVATSVEPNEEYFKAGYGNYCDAYDFHIYEDSANVRAAITQYQALMKKYNVVKPIWSTELGLNSQGMPRHLVAAELIKKFAVFFAAGGANVSWFDFLYPDGDGTNADSAGAAHDVFDSRYNLYAPKLTAIAYYNAVNAIAIKKFVAEKQYPDGIHAFLFRDRDGKALQIWWKDKGHADIAVPLPAVQAVDMVRLDGSQHPLNAAGQGITTSVSDEPLLILYDGGPNVLPAALGTPLATVAAAPPALRGTSTVVQVALHGVPAANVNLLVPSFWAVKKLPAAGGGVAQFDVTAPENSAVREADYTVTIGPDAAHQGELNVRVPVTGQLALQMQPVPAGANKAAAVRLIVTNNGAGPQPVNWELALDQEQSLNKGIFGAPSPTTAHLAAAPSGAATVAAHSSTQMIVPLAEVDPLKIYHVRATVDAAGRPLTTERLLGGLVAVPRVGVAPKLDGVLDEASWATAPVQHLNLAGQMQAIDAQAAPWKGAQDLSATMRYLWDDRYLYAAVEVTDDVAGKLQADDMLWAGDGLQFLVDPAREAAAKPGKYDFSVGVGVNGPRAWWHSSADAAVPSGLANDVIIGAKRKGDGTGAITYELAIPWSRLAPFKPGAGADLGLSLALNEDDGQGRHGFMTWFGDVQAKTLSTVGDLILEP